VSATTPKKIACVGDSITWGTFVWNRKRNSYPAQLQAMLGDRFIVRNFGVMGHTLQSAGDYPYRISKAFKSSSTFEPDVVLLMLGTNDSKAPNWKGIEPFAADYRELIAHYRSLDSAPAVYPMTPPALFGKGRRDKVRYGMDAAVVEEMGRAIRDIARELRLDVIDVHAATADHPEAFQFDGVHPGTAGATLIARAVFDVVAKPRG